MLSRIFVDVLLGHVLTEYKDCTRLLVDELSMHYNVVGDGTAAYCFFLLYCLGRKLTDQLIRSVNSQASGGKGG